MSFSVRLATPADSDAILAIYAPYVRDTAISFETEVPAPDEFAARVAGITARYPYLVCEVDNKIVGYAYASRHREREAYRFDVDVSVYVASAYQGSGVAHELYGCLFALLKELGYLNAYAVITQPNGRSVRFHQKFGFTPIGVHHKTGYKLGRWHDVTWMEKQVAELRESPKEVKGIGELSPEYLEHIFGVKGLQSKCRSQK